LVSAATVLAAVFVAAWLLAPLPEGERNVSLSVLLGVGTLGYHAVFGAACFAGIWAGLRVVRAPAQPRVT